MTNMTDLIPTMRKAEERDSDFAYLTKKASFKEYVEQVWGWDEGKQRQLHERRFKAQDFQVISLNSKDIGIVAIDVTPDCLKVNQLFLLPEYQGVGIGRQCMLIIMEKGRQLALPVRLGVLKVNPRARAFYERLGFVLIGETETHDLMECA